MGSNNNKVACIAPGVIGSSWATFFAMKGCPVVVCNIREKRLHEAEAFVKANLEYLSEKGVLTGADIEAALGQIQYSTDFGEALKDVWYIQESGPESYEIKETLLQTIEDAAPDDAIIASSTSGLLITEIAKNAKHPERCIGVHPYNPPHLIPLVEVTKGEKTSEDTVRRTYDFMESLGKEPVIVQKEALGNIANRLQMALYRESVDMVRRGICSVEDIDKALVFGPGLRWALLGIYMCFELSGGSDGIEGLLHKLEPGWEVWLKDMAKWEEFPDTWPQEVQLGVNEEMKNRNPEFGNDHESIIRFRDDCLLELLKMHKKL
jgi:3-hydroxyacyl-CoA dehydrogenase